MDDDTPRIDLEIELEKTRLLPLVAKAYTTLNLELVIVKLRVKPTAGLYTENFLFYPTEEFSTDRVIASIDKISGSN